ncbi:MZT2A protein, partial [Aleadryas rufinucha]|nr:MZT2A protein [Aleadryas rufinucha]
AEAWPGRARSRTAMSEAAAGMAAAAPMAEARLRRKQLLSAEEAELFELAQAAGSGLDPEVFRNKLTLYLQDEPVLPLECFLPVLISTHEPFIKFSLLCPAVTGEAENKTSSAVSGTQILAERSSREGSAQRMPRQPSASRMQKAGTSGKNSGGGNT